MSDDALRRLRPHIDVAFCRLVRNTLSYHFTYSYSVPRPLEFRLLQKFSLRPAEP
jgi:hypothetical protein